ncbi:MAG: aldehyde dehydrogenase family protein [Rhodobacteraceae bacterium]|nr:aldehyde dehydrogenase family protein [Paracoccaceae bacterium]
MTTAAKNPETPGYVEEYDAALAELDAAKDDWARTGIAERIRILSDISDGIMRAAEGWAETAARRKLIPPQSPLAGEEWISGPYATLTSVNALKKTLAKMTGKTFLDRLLKRQTVTGQLAIQVLPVTLWDRLLLSGISAEVWMQKGVSETNLKANAATAYDIPTDERKGKVALILGAGNIASIPPLDVLHKLFIENQVAILKMNPINDYLADYLSAALKPLIDRDALRIVRGDGQAGAYLADHPLVEELHVTGAAATHDAIVWGIGAEAVKNRKAGKPKNTRRFTSELGSVSPTIVVPGPWSAADIRFQAENIATQKLHNSGHNCIACQVLIMPKGWDKGAALMDAVRDVAAGVQRPAYYPGTDARLEAFGEHGKSVEQVDRGEASPPLTIASMTKDKVNSRTEVFGPALGTVEIDAASAEQFLKDAVDYANRNLGGTLGANILIHPATERQIGRVRFEEILAGFRYGSIAINGWSGLGFLIATCPWGAFPGHTVEDVQSGIGTVHNAFMLEQTERTVVRAPWRPFPRNLLSGEFSMLPRPPWFVTNRRQHVLGRLLTTFEHRPGWRHVPRIFINALRG